MRPLPNVPDIKCIKNEFVGKCRKIPIHPFDDFVVALMDSSEDRLISISLHDTGNFACVVGEKNKYLVSFEMSNPSVYAIIPTENATTAVHFISNNRNELCIIRNALDSYTISIVSICSNESQLQQQFTFDSTFSFCKSEVVNSILIIGLTNEVIFFDRNLGQFSLPFGPFYIRAFISVESTLFVASDNSFIIVDFGDLNKLRLVAKKKFDSTFQAACLLNNHEIAVILNDGIVQVVDLSKDFCIRKLFHSGYFNARNIFCTNDQRFLWIQEKYYVSMIDMIELKCVREFSFKPKFSSSCNPFLTIKQSDYLPRFCSFLCTLEDDSFALIDAENRDFCNSEKNFTSSLKIGIFSWNVSGAQIDSMCDEIRLSLPTILSDCDIIVIGLQEIVDINSKTTNAIEYFGGETSTQQSKLWTKLIEDSFPSFFLLGTAQMLGIYLGVFSKKSVLTKSLQFATLKTGLNGTHGNKGGVAGRFCIGKSSFCFICMHLPAGNNAKSMSDRNTDANSIMKGIQFSAGNDECFLYGGDGNNVFDHGNIFVLGDLNYRLDESISRENVLKLIHENVLCSKSAVVNTSASDGLSYLLEFDQLSTQMRRNSDFLLKYFSEIPINFHPTYKFDQGTNIYDTSAKMRTPAWTDRILYLVEDLNTGSYSSMEQNLVSDHKAVHAKFTISIK